MRGSKIMAVGALSAAAMLGSGTTAVSALGQDGAGHQSAHQAGHRAAIVLQETLAPSTPTGPVLHAVSPGGAPWALRHGSARLTRDGQLRVDVRGLVLPSANGTPGGVKTVTASLYCGNDTVAAGTTPAAEISRSGDARMEGTLTLTSTCFAPLVLVHPNASTTAYIAAGGF